MRLHLRWVPRLLVALVFASACCLTAGAEKMVPLDLARGKSASASSNQREELLPGMAVDGDPDTRWCASDGSAPQWLQVDLGKPQDLTGVRIRWEQDNQEYGYKIEGSSDARNWKTLVDQSDAAAGPQLREHKFAAEGVRYVRLNVVKLSGGGWASVFDFEVFGKQMVPAASLTATVRTPGLSQLHIKPPAGFDVTLFAAPPDVSYITCLTAAPTGPVFIGVDKDGSLGRKPGMGSIIRAIDSKGSGVADQFNVFATMDHPRGLVWDDGKLYVLHPPFLTVYYDDNHTGVANRSEDLVTGISTEDGCRARRRPHDQRHSPGHRRLDLHRQSATSAALKPSARTARS